MSELQPLPEKVSAESFPRYNNFENIFLDETTRENLIDQIREKTTDYSRESPVNQKVLDILEGVSEESRILYILDATLRQDFFPQHVDEYLARFQEDARILESFGYYFLAQAMDGTTYVPAAYFVGYFHLSPIDAAGRLEQSKATYDRRSKMPAYYIKSDFDYSDLQVRFSVAMAEYTKQIERISENPFLDPNEFQSSALFNSSEFKVLPDGDRALILTSLLSDTHNNMLFYEALNSQFTQESVERMNRRTYGAFNPGHSIIYNTKTSNSVFEYAQEFFNREMKYSFQLNGSEEYADVKIVLEILREILNLEPNETLIPILVDFWNKNRNPFFSNSIYSALRHHGQEEAIRELVELVKNPLVKNKNALTAMVFRLGADEMALSSHKVDVYGNEVSLPGDQVFAKALRINREGDIGLFDQAGVLQSFFSSLEVLSTDSHDVSATLSEIDYYTLFSENPNSLTEEDFENRRDFVARFKDEYLAAYHGDFYDKTGIQFNNLSFKEQGAVMRFLYQNGPNIKEQVFEFISKYKEPGLRTFLSLEYFEDAGHKLLELFSSDDENSQRKIIGLFDEIVNIADEAGAYMHIDSDRLEEVKTAMTKRATVLLASALSGNQELISRLDTIKGENVLLVETYKVMQRTGLQDVRDLHEVTVSSFGPTENRLIGRLEEIKNLYTKNYSEVRADELYQNLITDMSKPGFKFIMTSYKEKILSFGYVVENIEDKTAYIGGLNINPELDLRGAEAGIAFMNYITEQYERSNWDLVAKADARVSFSHVREREFVITKRLEDKEGSVRFEVVRKKGINWGSKNTEIFNKNTIQGYNGFIDDNNDIFVYSVKDINEIYIPEGMVIGNIIMRGGFYYFICESL